MEVNMTTQNKQKKTLKDEVVVTMKYFSGKYESNIATKHITEQIRSWCFPFRFTLLVGFICFVKIKNLSL